MYQPSTRCKVRLYTDKIGEYVYSRLDENYNIIHTPYEHSHLVRPHPYKLIDPVYYTEEDYKLDVLHDYLTFPDIELTEEEKELLDGFDLDPDHYADVICVYLPFVHFIHLTEHWII